MLVRWDPFREMNSLQREINRLFADSKSREGNEEKGFVKESSWMPVVDISENEKEFIVKAELPGMEQKDIEISLEENRLTIQGERKVEKEEEGENYLRREMTCGSFYRAFNITTSVDDEKITASYENGILKISLPKVEKAKPKKIEIK